MKNAVLLMESYNEKVNKKVFVFDSESNAYNQWGNTLDGLPFLGSLVQWEVICLYCNLIS
jgi:hypothetical protein